MAFFISIPQLPQLPHLPGLDSGPFGLVIVVALGLALLVAGRKVFWLAFGAIGFVTGLYLSTLLPSQGQHWMQLALAVGCGLAGILLTLFIKKVALGVAGFLLGGAGAVWLAIHLGAPVANWEWAVFAVGGVIGAAFASWLFELALVVLSSAVGASLLLKVIPVSGLLEVLIFAALVILGISAQSRKRRRSS